MVLIILWHGHWKICKKNCEKRQHIWKNGKQHMKKKQTDYHKASMDQSSILLRCAFKKVHLCHQKTAYIFFFNRKTLKTMKMLFCSICLTYDCGQHSLDDLTKIVIFNLFRKTINMFLLRILSLRNKS